MAFRKVLHIYGAWLALDHLFFKGEWLFKTVKNCLNLVQLSIFSFARTLLSSFLNFEEPDCQLLKDLCNLDFGYFLNSSL